MTRTEIAKRLAAMSPELISKVEYKIREGNGGNTIAFETCATVKQINAVFAARRHARTVTEFLASLPAKV